MNSPIVTPGIYQLGATSAYTVLQPMSERLVSFGQMYTTFSFWRKFIRRSIQQPGSESGVTVVSAERTTTEGPTVLRPAPLPEDYEARIEEFLRFLDDLEAGAYAADDIVAGQ